MRAWIAAFAVISVFVTTTAHAQGSMRTKVRRSRVVVQEQHMNRLQLDAFPLLGKGVGGAYQRTIGSRFTLGPHAFYMQMDPSDGSVRNTHKILGYGLSGRYFFTGRADSGSWYLLGGVQAANVETTSAFDGDEADTVRTTSVGPLVGIGHQSAFSDRVVMDVGATYGRGYQISTKTESFLRTSRVVSHEVLDSIFFELVFGVLF